MAHRGHDGRCGTLACESFCVAEFAGRVVQTLNTVQHKSVVDPHDFRNVFEMVSMVKTTAEIVSRWRDAEEVESQETLEKCKTQIKNFFALGIGKLMTPLLLSISRSIAHVGSADAKADATLPRIDVLWPGDVQGALDYVTDASNAVLQFLEKAQKQGTERGN